MSGLEVLSVPRTSTQANFSSQSGRSIDPPTCIVIGGTTLAIDCVHRLREADYVVTAVLPTDQVFDQWARCEALHRFENVDELSSWLLGEPADWLFSVVNPSLLPSTLLASIRRGSFNYHDAPLPRYAGTHATSWALLALETEYAITWHRIDAAVDAGDIVVQRAVEITETDTALSLNLKCYIAARSAFDELLSELVTESRLSYPQDLAQRTFFARSRRPDAAGFLQWEKPAHQLSALVRALDFGDQYFNPLALPKILLAGGVVAVGALEVLDDRSGSSPGTMVSLNAEGWRIATGSQDVFVKRIQGLNGTALDPLSLASNAGLHEGSKLELLSAEQASTWMNACQTIARHESFWIDRLMRASPLRLPYQVRSLTPDSQVWQCSVWNKCSVLEAIAPTARINHVMGALFVYLARITGEPRLQLGWAASSRDMKFASTPSQLFAPVVPMEIEVDPDRTFSAILDDIAGERAQLERNLTFATDLIGRHPGLRGLAMFAGPRPWSVAAVVVDDRDDAAALGMHAVEEAARGGLLTLQICASDGSFRWVYNALGSEWIERMTQHLSNLLRSTTDREAACASVAQLDILSSEERQLLLHGWNDTEQPFPRDRCVHQLFEEQVARTPEAIAVVFEDRELTYAELNRRANRLAHYLRELGVKPDERVAICVERGFEMMVGLLAVLKAGGAYVPLDPAYPPERLRFMLDDSAPVALLTQAHLNRLLPVNSSVHVLLLDNQSAAWNSHADRDPDPAAVGLTPDHLAYVIYTSGSTGTPKGVMVEHGGLVNLVVVQISALALDSTSRVLQFASFSFDACAFEIFATLCQGASLRLRLQEDVLSGAASPSAIDSDVTHATLPPAVLAALPSGAELGALRTLVVAGDVLSSNLADRWKPRRRLINAYGPTEATICATMHVCDDTESRAVPIGRPIANTRVYILDGQGEPPPIGVAGEIYIGGAGVARGYLNRPELTAERFLKDPFASEPGARMYKTGDLGRWSLDGNIEFLGRNDFQVKIRGFRIELGEIEARLQEHPAIREAVVLACEDQPGDKRLVAYYVPVAVDQDELGADALRSHLTSSLPEYMVPSAYVRLKALPLTPNGKLDRKALPVPKSDAYSFRGYEEPEGDIEILLARIWAEVLKLDRVGRNDNFFQLGGHSLLAVTLIERMRRSGVRADVRALFATPTLAEFAAAVDSAEPQVRIPPNPIPAECTALTPEMLPLIELSTEQIDRILSQVPGGAGNVQDIYPLAPLQEGVLFHYLMAQLGDPYLLSHFMAFDNRDRLDTYLEAMQEVVDRHDILRTAIFWEGLPEPVQVVLREAVLPVQEVLLDADAGDAVEQLRARFDPRRSRIALHQAPLLRVFTIHDTKRSSWLMMMLLHHLAGDHTTLEVLQEEIQAHLLGRQEYLPAPLPFRNLVAQARLGISREEHEALFRKMLGDVDEPTAPFGLLEVRGDGTDIVEASMELEATLSSSMREHARRLRVSVASLCHLAWAQVLARISGREDVVFGTVLFGRMQGGEGADRVMGPFINTLPLRLHIGERSARESVRHTHTLLTGLLRHEHASLALAQRCSAVQAPAPLFSSLLNYRHSTMSMFPTSEALQPQHGIEWIGAEERTNYPCLFSVDDLGNGFRLAAQVDASINPTRVCVFMQTALASLVTALERAPETPLRTLDVLPAEERRQVLYGWNDTAAEFPSEKCVHHLFEEQVARTPEATALVFENSELTFAELNRQANRLAHSLRELGIRPDDRVALCVERGFEMIIALLAVLKAGGAYVPLDPAYPAERLRFMLDDSAPVALLTQTHLRQLLPASFSSPVLLLDDQSRAWNRHADTDPDPVAVALTPDHLAYIIYTSGSTGAPKGVSIEHRNAVNFLSWGRSAFPQDFLARTLFSTSLNFDLAVFECFLPIIVGATVQIVSDVLDLARGPLHVTLINTVPSAMGALLDANSTFPRTRTVNLAGEPLRHALVERIFSATAVDTICNLYGPSETTTYSTWVAMRRGEPFAAHVGRPIANTRIYILDAYGEPAPVGVAGEIYIGGAGVARGYLNRPELTAERFLKDPFVSERGARMYKTGDLGRWLPDGNIEFLGRNDDQVKIRGFRIELGEIEARLQEHPAIHEAVVLAREDQPGDKRLVAYYTAADSHAQEPSTQQLRSHLAHSLPEYTVPAVYVRLDSLPLTPNGKLDRRALPVPDGDAFPVRQYEPPVGETETTLAAIWAELFKLDRVGRYDNFFELGGHSLLAVQLISRIQQAFQLEVRLATLFAHPSLQEFAGVLHSAEQASLPSIPPVERNDQLPLSFAQQRLWFLAQMDGARGGYHIPFGLELTGELDRLALRQALDRILVRHEALRTTFSSVDGMPMQRIGAAESSRFHLLEHDLRQRKDPRSELERLRSEEVNQSFDLEHGPLIRGRLIRLDDEHHTLLITMHHIISDGWSVEIWTDEFSVLYRAYRQGLRDPLAPLPVQYADYAMWQRQWIEGEILQQQGEFWKNSLAGAPPLLELPADHPRPAEQDYSGSFVALQLDTELSAGLRTLSRRYETTLYMTLLAGWATLLARLSGQQDLVIGAPAANRRRREIEGIIGFFVNTLALRLDLSDAPAVDELLERVKAQTLAAQQHQDIPFEQVVELAAPVRSLAHSPLFQVGFAWQNLPQGSRVLPGLTAQLVEVSADQVSKFDLSLSLQETGDSISGGILYATALFERSTIERFLGYFRNLLQGMVANPAQSIDRLPMLPADERQQVLDGWNDTAAEFPSERCAHQLFEAQVARTPEATALVFENRELSYAELNRQANRLAHYLRELGVRPDDRVAICVERGFEMMVGLLAVLKAGGAYVPLDPAYPAERLRFMLDDSAPVALLTQTHLRQLLPVSFSFPVLPLDSQSRAWNSYPDTDLDAAAVALTPDHLAYIIYTSGSTGAPKGVMVQHRPLAIKLEATGAELKIGAQDVLPNLASQSFDISLLELLLPLTRGGTTLLLAAKEVRDVAQLVEKTTTATFFHAVPSLMEAWIAFLGVEGAGTKYPALRTLLVGGEAVSDLLLQKLIKHFPQADVVELYGPTEATVISTSYHAHAARENLVKHCIGRPLRNTRIYILDGYGEPAPIGVAGEIHIGGAGVACGYLNRPDLSAERFPNDPFAHEPGARMYKTGDLGRWLPDGNIEFLGRNDLQVKIRGFRIELGEIETRLGEHPGVREALVLAREDQPGDKRLVAYYVPVLANQGDLSADSLRSYLSEALPEYMVPAAYVRLEALPLTPNGKLDRNALPAPDGDAAATRSYEEPQGETENLLAGIWTELLNLDRVGRYDNFFELGGHSLLAVPMIERLRRSEVQADIRTLFAAPTLAELALAITKIKEIEL